MVKNVLIIGSGSISKKHKYILNLISRKIKIITIPSRKFNKNFFAKKKINFDYFIICSPSTFHYEHLKIIEKYFIKKKVLIEKPLFNKYYKFNKNLKNNIYVGYNLRFHPVILFLKKFLLKKVIFSVNVLSHSFLPFWRKINYMNSVSAHQKLGGGALLELSHELDYLKWIFKKIKIKDVFNKKVSNLKVNTDDILNITGKLSNNIFFNLNLNFFSRLSERSIKIDGKNLSLYADLINNSIKIIYKKNKRIIKFSKFNILDTYKKQHLEIINDKILLSCTFNSALNLTKTIQIIKEYDQTF
jgi:CMP-N,N'-diacetyllegionaminic acid synthase